MQVYGEAQTVGPDHPWPPGEKQETGSVNSAANWHLERTALPPVSSGPARCLSRSCRYSTGDDSRSGLGCDRRVAARCSGGDCTAPSYRSCSCRTCLNRVAPRKRRDPLNLMSKTDGSKSVLRTSFGLFGYPGRLCARIDGVNRLGGKYVAVSAPSVGA